MKPKKRAVQHLLKCLYLYSGHRVDSRGASSLILDAIRELDADTAERLVEGVEPVELLRRLPNGDLAV